MTTVSTSQTEPHTRAKPYDHTVSPALMEVHISETFTGDMDGESPVRASFQPWRGHCSAEVVRRRARRGFVNQLSKMLDFRFSVHQPSIFTAARPYRHRGFLRRR
jgi:hypothetical protein